MCAISVFGQTLDQSNAPSDIGGGGFTVSSTGNVGQSFTAGLTGNLSQVNVRLGDFSSFTAGDFQIRIFDGEGYGGSVLNTTVFNVSSVPSFNYAEIVVPLSSTPAIVAGNKYTIDLRGISGAASGHGTGGGGATYTAGLFYANQSPFNSYSLWFKTFVTLPTPATHLNFDGVNDYITLANENNFDFTNQMTVEFWMNSNVTPEQWDALIVKGDDSWRVSLTATGTVAFTGTNAFTDFYSTTSVTDGNWHHVAATYDGINAKIYIDGILENQLGGTANLNNSTYSVSIGENLQMLGRYFTGNMDDIRIWNTARTVTQINAAMSCELQGNESGLVAYYQFNQGIDQANNSTITTLFDTTSNANSGALTNFALNGATSNWLAGSAVITGSTIPVAPTANNQTFCTASTVNDLMPAPSATTNWYSSATSSTALNPTDAITTNTYYVASVNAAGCESDRVAVNVTVSNFTVTITSQNNVSCYGGNDGSVSLSVSGGVAPYTILWDDGSADAFTRNNLTAGNYRAWITDDLGCTDYIIGGGGTLVTITEPAELTAPIVTTPVTYNQGDVAVPLTATSSGDSLLWYTTATGGTGSTTAPTPSTATVGSTSYWVSSTSGSGCESSTRSEIVVTVNAFTSAPTTTWSTQVYTGDNKDLTELEVLGANILWYDAATGGNLLPNTTLLVDETTYYASQTLGSVESTNRLAITVNRISDNTQLLPPGSTVADLVSTPSASTTSQWFANATGGAPLSGTDVLSNGVYYVEQSTNLTTVETVGSGFNMPYGIAVQADGKILVTDIGNNAIKRMNPDGTNIEILTPGVNINSFSGITVQPDGKIVFMGNDTGNRIMRMNSDGSNVETLISGLPFTGGLAIQNDGKILFTTIFNVMRMDSDGSNNQAVGPVFSFSRGVTVQPDGKIVVAETNNFAVKRMNPDGTNVESLNEGNYYPYGIAIQSDGKIVFADDHHKGINRMNSDGSNVEVLTSTNGPRGLAIESNGNILFVDASTNTVNRIILSTPSNRVPVNVDVTTLSTSSFALDNFNIYPNPTSGVFTIKTEEALSVEVYDVTGRLILKDYLQTTKTLSIERQEAGMYLINIKNKFDQLSTFKIIKL